MTTSCLVRGGFAFLVEFLASSMIFSFICDASTNFQFMLNLLDDLGRRIGRLKLFI
jgi:hypothetical protein